MSKPIILSSNFEWGQNNWCKKTGWLYNFLQSYSQSHKFDTICGFFNLQYRKVQQQEKLSNIKRLDLNYKPKRTVNAPKQSRCQWCQKDSVVHWQPWIQLGCYQSANVAWKHWNMVKRADHMTAQSSSYCCLGVWPECDLRWQLFWCLTTLEIKGSGKPMKWNWKNTLYCYWFPMSWAEPFMWVFLLFYHKKIGHFSFGVPSDSKPSITLHLMA